MKILQQLAQLFGKKKGRKPVARHGVRLLLEALEPRWNPSNEYLWVGPGPGQTDLLFSNGYNWKDEILNTFGTVPTSTSYVTFNSSGSNNDCYADGNFSVDRVNMQGTYTGTLHVGVGKSVDAATLFEQNGGLALTGGSISCTGGDLYLNGTVTGTASSSTTPASSAHITAGSGLFISGATIYASGAYSGADDLILTSDAIDDGGTISVGVGYAAASLRIEGSITVDPSSLITMKTTSTLTFAGSGVGSTFDVKGEIDMNDSVIDNDTPLYLDQGKLVILSGGCSVTGDVQNDNGGTIRFTGTAYDSLTISGDYTQGSPSPNTNGNLEMLITNGHSNLLSVGGTATLAGTITVNAVGTLPTSASWSLIHATGGYGANPFDTLNLPAGYSWTPSYGTFYFEISD